MAITIVEQSGGQYHVLVIIADGQVILSISHLFFVFITFIYSFILKISEQVACLLKGNMIFVPF